MTCLHPGLVHAECTRAANVRSGNLMLSLRVQCPLGFCKLADEPAFAVAEYLRGATGGSDGRLALGSLPYFSVLRWMSSLQTEQPLKLQLLDPWV